jgi:broad specificity phosphatase PhoE
LILLARHGETDDNAPPRRVQGRRNPPLNDRGREQARELAAAVAGEGLAALWTSDMRRARETAAIVAAEVGLEPRVDPRLAEGDWGSWQGRLIEDIAREDAELWAAFLRAGPDFRFPDGESLAEHMARVSEALDEIAEGPSPALVVCHGGTIRCAFARTHPRGLDAFHEIVPANGQVMPLP